VGNKVDLDLEKMTDANLNVLKMQMGTISL